MAKSASGKDEAKARTPAGTVLTIGELCDYLKLPKSTAYKLAQEGRIPGQKVGRHWRFSREAIDRWLAEGGSNARGRG